MSFKKNVAFAILSFKKKKTVSIFFGFWEILNYEIPRLHSQTEGSRGSSGTAPLLHR